MSLYTVKLTITATDRGGPYDNYMTDSSETYTAEISQKRRETALSKAKRLLEAVLGGDA
jgi:hypothetical protein